MAQKMSPGRRALLDGPAASQKKVSARPRKAKTAFPWYVVAITGTARILATLDVILMAFLFWGMPHESLNDVIALCLIPGLLSLSYLISWISPAYGSLSALATLLAFLFFMHFCNLGETLPLNAIMALNLPTALLLAAALARKVAK